MTKVLLESILTEFIERSLIDDQLKDLMLRNVKKYVENKRSINCPFCGKSTRGFVLTHYKCKACNEYFTD